MWVFFQNFDLIARNFREKKAKLQKGKKLGACLVHEIFWIRLL